MARIISFFFVSALFILTFAHNSVSKPMENSESVIHDYKRFEAALNQNIQSLDIVDFLHVFVAADAEFKMQLLDTKNQKTENIGIDKTAYINSFLQGRKFLEDYNAQIENVEVLSEDLDGMLIKHRMVETGAIKQPSRTKQPFTSITDCTLSHTLDEGSFTVSGGECSTQILINQDI